jgi:hypothetical protein
MRCLPALLIVPLLATGAAGGASAQVLPERPLSLMNGQISISGEVTGSIAPRPDPGFFDFTDYEHNALRMLRLSVSARWRPSERLAVLTEIRSENLERPTPYALFVRVRPWKSKPFDIQAGRIPAVFGAFPRRAYGTDNPVIGVPLGYQYLTSLRADAVPATADDLLLMRGRGWRDSFPVGASNFAPGQPIVSSYRWDTGVEAHVDAGRFEAAAAVTAGTLSNPRVSDDNDGRQLSARIGLRPFVGAIVGISGARGEWLASSVRNRLVPMSLQDRSYPQTAFGLDAEYSRAYFLVRGEVIVSRWTLPAISEPFLASPLRATASYVEGRYRLSPRFFAGARADHLDFSNVQGLRLANGLATPWEYPVTRVEAGGGMYLQRNLVLRAVVQRNWRDGGRVRNATFASGQVSYWF